MDQNSEQGSALNANGSLEAAKDIIQQGLIETTGSEVAEEGAEIAASADKEQKAEQKEEQKVEEVKQEENPQEKLFSAKFAALSRKEKALKKREREIEARIAELEKRTKSTTETAPAQESLEIRLKRDPFNTLKEMGLGYDVLTNIALNDGKLTPELQMQLMEQKLRQEHTEKMREIEEKLARKEEEELRRAHEERVNNFKLSIDNFVQSNKNDYELLSVEGEDGVQLVFDVMDEHYKETEEVLDLKTATELVENYLLEEAKKRVGLSKVKKLLGASEEKAPIAPAKPEQKKQSVTLTNSQSQSATTGRRGLSEEEQLVEAAKLIRWNAE